MSSEEDKTRVKPTKAPGPSDVTQVKPSPRSNTGAAPASSGASEPTSFQPSKRVSALEEANIDASMASQETKVTAETEAVSDIATLEVSGTLPFEMTFPEFENTEPSSISGNDDLLPGAVIKQRFVLEKRIGQGGMGTIFLARDKRKVELQDSDSQIVIKFLNEELADNLGAIMALQREAKKSQALSHPNIVTVYDFDRENTMFFLSMEYLQGESLDQYISRSANRMTKPATIMRYVELMARGLAYAHQEGFVHADFKPANVFLTDSDQIKVLDFGIAQAVRSNLESGPGEDTVFDPGAMGALTPNYASLEMLEKERPIPADDVYALACVAYEMLAGVHPFRLNGKRMNAVDAQANNLEVAPIAGISKRHMKAIRKGLAFRRSDRYANAGEFIDAIKPRVKLGQSMLILIAVLVVTVVVSWGITVNTSDAVIGFDDLPDSMANIVSTIKEGDEIFDVGDVDQAHRLYAQAWEAGFDVALADSRDQYKLKVIVDRRINKIIQRLIDKASEKDLDTFTLMQLQVSLEFLKKDDLGSLDEQIDRALKQIQVKIDQG